MRRYRLSEIEEMAKMSAFADVMATAPGGVLLSGEYAPESITNSLALATVTILLAVGGGCGEHNPTSGLTTSSTHGRELTALIDGRASFEKDFDDHIITFGGHKLVVRKEWLVVDGDKGLFGIPPRARKVEIKFNRGILTLTADGSELIKTPI
jgi:hypothetical protein